MSLLWRNWFAFVGILATVLGVLGFLSVLQHDAILSRLMQERLAVIAETAASSFRLVVNLGLPISTMRNAEEVLRRARAIDPAVTSIHVFNPSGIVVHSTNREEVAPLSRELLLAQAFSKTNRWSAPSENELQAGFTIKNQAGTTVGGVLVGASKNDFMAKSESTRRRIAVACAIILVVFSALALVVLRVRLGAAIRGLAKLQSLSRRFSADDEGNGAATGTGPGSVRSPTCGRAEPVAA